MKTKSKILKLIISLIASAAITAAIFSYCSKSKPPPALKPEAKKVEQTPPPAPAETALDRKYKKIAGEIFQVAEKWAKSQPVDRVAAVIAVNPVQILEIPGTEEHNVKRGPFIGDIVTVKVQGSPRDIAILADNFEKNYTAITIESIEAEYITFEDIRVFFRLFSPATIPIEPLPAKASEAEKEKTIGKIEQTLKDVQTLLEGTNRSFSFLADVNQRWPFDYPPLDRVKFENNTYTIYTSIPLSHPDPLIVELSEELSRSASPAKVNLTSLIGPLIDARNVKASLTNNELVISWNNLRILEIKAQIIGSYLIDRNVVFVTMTANSDERSEQPKDGNKTEPLKWLVRGYDLRDGSIIWETAFPPDGYQPTNMMLDYDHRFLFGRGFLLTAHDPSNGHVIKRWPLSGKAMEVYPGAEGNLIVRMSTFNGDEMNEEIRDDKRTAPLLLHAGMYSANQLLSETMYKLVGEVPQNLSQKEETISDIIGKNMDEVTKRLPGLTQLDPTNPWYLFVDGITELISKSDKAPEKFQKTMSMPMENPYYYLVLGSQFDILGLDDRADAAYEEGLKLLLNWYRPNEIYSGFTGSTFFTQPAKKMILSGRADRAEKLLLWLRKFQPFGSKMDWIELESAAWWHRRGNKGLESAAMARYRLASQESFRMTFRRAIKFDLVRLFTWTFIIVYVLIWLIMYAKYRKVQRSYLNSAKINPLNRESRTRSLFDVLANLFKFSTISFLSRREKMAMLLLWLILFLSASAFLITRQLIKAGDDSLLVDDYNLPGFVNSLEKRFVVDPQPETIFMLGLAYQQNGDIRKAQSYYENPILVSSGGNIAARTLNNLGVIAFSGEKRNEAQKYFKKAVENDPWQAEPLYNLGIMEKKDTYKQRALVLGLEPEYLQYYPDKPVRCGPDADIFSASLTGFSYNIMENMANHWAEIITGNFAWKYAGKNIIVLWYLYLILGLELAVYMVVPRHNIGTEAHEIRWWYPLIPGVGLIFQEKILSGIIILAVFLFSLSLIYMNIRWGVPGALAAMNAISPSIYPTLKTADLLHQEPLLKEIKICAWAALFMALLANSIWVYGIRKEKK